MKVSEQRLEDILNRLTQAQEIATVSREEWRSIALELRQLRLRTSAQSRSATVSQGAATSS